MQIFKAIVLPVMGISILIWAVYTWAWKQPRTFTGLGDEAGTVSPASGLTNAPDNLIIYNMPATLIPSDSEVNRFMEKWEKEKPQLLLVEGKKGFFLPGLMDPVKKFGLEGKALELALKNKIEIYSYNLPDEIVAEKLLKKFLPEQIALSFILCSYFRNSKAANNLPRECALRESIYFNRNIITNAKINSAQDIDKIWGRDFKDLKSWRDSNYLPGYTGEIETEAKRIRQNHYNNLINYFVRQNKKVFVVGNPVQMDVYGENK